MLRGGVQRVLAVAAACPAAGSIDARLRTASALAAAARAAREVVVRQNMMYDNNRMILIFLIVIPLWNSTLMRGICCAGGCLFRGSVPGEGVDG